MELQEIKALLEQQIPNASVEIEGDGYHFQVTVISDIFAGKTPVKKQQLVYAALNEQIVSGAIHAISIKTYTPDEWQQRS
ncbi:MAG: cell division protein BolA [Gammaproteobacteria bacterium]|jgi:acid stress-induced BolA-like protein IbaG/YrbA|nr:cell division protein BolA [Gammaproteobacteria bacterium]